MSHDNTREDVRAVFRLPGGKRRQVWAAKLPSRGRQLRYQVLTREEERSREGATSDVILYELIVATPGDVISEKPARLNLHYGEMEVVP